MSHYFFLIDCIEMDHKLSHNDLQPAALPSLISNESSSDPGYDLNGNHTSAHEPDITKIQILSDEKVDLIPRSAFEFRCKLNKADDLGSDPIMIEQNNTQLQQPQNQFQLIVAQYYDIGNTRLFVIPQQHAATSIVKKSANNSHVKVLNFNQK